MFIFYNIIYILLFYSASPASSASFSLLSSLFLPSSFLSSPSLLFQKEAPKVGVCPKATLPPKESPLLPPKETGLLVLLPKESNVVGPPENVNELADKTLLLWWWNCRSSIGSVISVISVMSFWTRLQHQNRCRHPKYAIDVGLKIAVLK